MKFRMTIEWDESIGVSVVDVLSFIENLELFFANKNYGDGVDSIFIILIVRSGLFKQRKRFVKSNRILDFDIVLDIESLYMKDDNEKMLVVKNSVIENVECVLLGYDFLDFNSGQLVQDMRSFLCNE